MWFSTTWICDKYRRWLIPFAPCYLSSKNCVAVNFNQNYGFEWGFVSKRLIVTFPNPLAHHLNSFMVGCDFVVKFQNSMEDSSQNFWTTLKPSTELLWYFFFFKLSCRFITNFWIHSQPTLTFGTVHLFLCVKLAKKQLFSKNLGGGAEFVFIIW